MKCLSIRQPWAWLIIHGGKDVENRDWPTKVRGRVLVHASQGMTRAEYDDAFWQAHYIEGAAPFTMPEPGKIERGGIIGSVEIVDCVDASTSPWFFGRYGFVLRNPIALPFRPYKGRLGFFDVPEASS
jgi:hypothetical protein